MEHTPLVFLGGRAAEPARRRLHPLARPEGGARSRGGGVETPHRLGPGDTAVAATSPSTRPGLVAAMAVAEDRAAAWQAQRQKLKAGGGDPLEVVSDASKKGSGPPEEGTAPPKVGCDPPEGDDPPEGADPPKEGTDPPKVGTGLPRPPATAEATEATEATETAPDAQAAEPATFMEARKAKAAAAKAAPAAHAAEATEATGPPPREGAKRAGGEEPTQAAQAAEGHAARTSSPVASASTADAAMAEDADAEVEGVPSLSGEGRLPLSARSEALTHPGGYKPQESLNQDACFVLRLDEHRQAWGVFDGHGSEHGELVARTAAAAIEGYLREHFGRLRDEPEEAFVEAFSLAHSASKRELLLRVPSLVEDSQGALWHEWSDDEGVLHAEAADGGTTATVIALLDGETIIHAQAGDSSALLGGRRRDVSEGNEEASIAFEEMLEEHSATNPSEYARVLSTPRGGLLRFVYETPELWDQNGAQSSADKKKRPLPPEVFRRELSTGEGYELDARAHMRAKLQGALPKNVRGDLPAVIITPKDDGESGGRQRSPQHLAMTRSIGDFYMQTFGITWRPEVITVDLAEVLDSLSSISLLIASDGIWDLWESEEAFAAIVQPRVAASSAQQLQSRANAFFEESLRRGHEMFGEAADNLTAIVVHLGAPVPSSDLAGGPQPQTVDSGPSAS